MRKNAQSLNERTIKNAFKMYSTKKQRVFRVAFIEQAKMEMTFPQYNDNVVE